MRILIVSPSLNIGGIERHLSVFAESFVKLGQEVFFISCINIKQFYHLSDSIKLYKAPFKRTKGLVNAMFFRAWLLFYLRKKITDIQPDVVLVLGDVFNPLVLLATTRTKIPVFIGDTTSPDYNFDFLVRVLKRITYPKSTGIICQTKYAEAYKKKLYRSKINTLVLDNPIKEIKHYNIARENIILYAGRFAWEKAPERLIRAFAMIENKKDWKLVMAGSGPLLSKSKQLAKDLGVESKVEFLGDVEHVDKLYSKASIFVLPSVIEGFPNVLCEAMIAGLAVVCFDDFPSHEIITHNFDGIIISEGKLEKLANELDRLIHDKSERERLGSNAKKIKERLDPLIISRKLLDFMQESIEKSL